MINQPMERSDLIKKITQLESYKADLINSLECAKSSKQSLENERDDAIKNLDQLEKLYSAVLKECMDKEKHGKDLQTKLSKTQMVII